MTDEINFLVLADADIGELYLMNRGGGRSPVLRFLARNGKRDLLPGDKIDFGAGKCGTVSAAELVAAWGGKPKRIEEARRAAAEFLRQWPEGPQLDFPDPASIP
jgi:hypothetical protein